jgi:hypothetical protein
VLLIPMLDLALTMMKRVEMVRRPPAGDLYCPAPPPFVTIEFRQSV